MTHYVKITETNFYKNQQKLHLIHQGDKKYHRILVSLILKLSWKAMEIASLINNHLKINDMETPCFLSPDKLLVHFSFFLMCEHEETGELQFKIMFLRIFLSY
ncbi:hypothetical protein HZH66_011453 [Vespula vulgaris]|uniref:Uncharacterized protein n=1 Tax=Vespula vulgaris TaxID=7454 RepID=A0A834JKB7_VESVU|nr:hypothetical protein HZH66_011453 [Vespula vulgaris]